MSEALKCWECSAEQAHHRCSFCHVSLCNACKDDHEAAEKDMRTVEETETEDEAGDSDAPWPDENNGEDE